MFLILFLLSMGTKNGIFILQARQDTIKHHIRDISMDIEGDNRRFTYQWRRDMDKYKITVYKKEHGGYSIDYILIFIDGRLYKHVPDSSATYPIPFYNEYNISLLDWINFVPGELSWRYEEGNVIVHFKDKKHEGDLFLTRQGKILRVRCPIMGENVWIKYKVYQDVAGVKDFPVEWDVYIGGEVKHYKVYSLRVNKGLCPCTFKLPK